MRDELPHKYIKHVVVLMLENRGFDHLMGWLYPALLGAPTPKVVPAGDQRPFMGLSGLTAEQLDLLKNPLPNENGSLPINKGARSPKTPAFNTGESFEHIMNQLWSAEEPAPTWLNPVKRAAFMQQHFGPNPPPPPMTGFVLDYDEETFAITGEHFAREDLSEVLDTYTPEQVPVLSGLARGYAVSDEWFCSVPSQTNTNRAFSMTGTSRGLVNNSFYDPESWQLAPARVTLGGKSHADALPVSTRSLFEVLQEANFNWKVYWQAPWPPRGLTGFTWQYTRTMIPLLGDKQFDNNFVSFDASDPDNVFFEAARRGDLPAVSWIEPRWGGGLSWKMSDSWKPRAVGNDYHPVSDTTTGEDFVMDVYLALSQSPAWNETLLVITFDENGGTYDHVAPPPAVPSGLDGCPLPHPPIDRHDMDAATRTQFGYDFTQYGVRVPTLLVGPCVPAGTLFRSDKQASDGTPIPYDHTSIIATILTLAQIPPTDWAMGERVANAPTFDSPELLGEPVVREPAAAALSVPFLRSGDAPLTYDTDYVFEFLGDIWRTQPGPLYLTAHGSGVRGVFKYPTLTSDPTKALSFRLEPAVRGPMPPAVRNMAKVLLKTTEPSLAGTTPFFTVNHTNPDAFYDHDKGAPSHWQIRLLGSRYARDEVCVNDYVFFVCQLPPPALLPGMVAPDPFQRLCSDTQRPGFVTTRAGEWALWRIRPPPPPKS